MCTIVVIILFLHAGTDSATARVIFAKMNSVLQENQILWDNCVGVSVDNTSVNIGTNNSIMTRVHEKHPAAYFMGCPCHIIHNTSVKAAECFNQVAII